MRTILYCCNRFKQFGYLYVLHRIVFGRWTMPLYTLEALVYLMLAEFGVDSCDYIQHQRCKHWNWMSNSIVYNNNTNYTLFTVNKTTISSGLDVIIAGCELFEVSLINILGRNTCSRYTSGRFFLAYDFSHFWCIL